MQLCSFTYHNFPPTPSITAPVWHIFWGGTDKSALRSPQHIPYRVLWMGVGVIILILNLCIYCLSRLWIDRASADAHVTQVCAQPYRWLWKNNPPEKRTLGTTSLKNINSGAVKDMQISRSAWNEFMLVDWTRDWHRPKAENPSFRMAGILICLHLMNVNTSRGSLKWTQIREIPEKLKK